MSLLRLLNRREKSDLFGIGATCVIMSMILVNNLTTLYKKFSQIEADHTLDLVLLVTGLFFAFNVFGNMYKVITTDTSIYSLALPSTLLPEWRYCSFCEQNSPPRAFHCYSCKRCILKRHNHCTFLGSCVGHKNIRYYLLFILHVWLGLLVSNLINWDYYVRLLNEFDLKHFFIFFMPMFAFAFGMISLYDLFIIFANALSALMSVLLVFYFSINFLMATSNQTWHERAKRIEIYNLGFRQNFLETFGLMWHRAFLNPFSSSRLPSDGAVYKLNTKLDLNALASQSNMNNNFNISNNDLTFRRKELNTVNAI